MRFNRRQGIVPQAKGHKARASGSRVQPRQGLLGVALGLAVLALVGCAGVRYDTQPPQKPATLSEARAYMAAVEPALARLDYEINQKTRACYDRFFVSSCVEDVRYEGAKLRRSYLEIKGEASDMIRLDDYNRRQASKVK